jgi:hypothetical protein
MPLEQSPSVIEVPAGDAAGHYCTIEYRDPTMGYARGTAWGQKLPGPSVVIHVVRTNGLSYLVDQQAWPSFQTCGVFVGATTSNGTGRILSDSLPSPWTGNEAFVRVGSVGDGVLAPGACSASGVAAVTGGAGGGPDQNCQYPNCGPRPLPCNFATGRTIRCAGCTSGTCSRRQTMDPGVILSGSGNRASARCPARQTCVSCTSVGPSWDQPAIGTSG